MARRKKKAVKTGGGNGDLTNICKMAKFSVGRDDNDDIGEGLSRKKQRRDERQQEEEGEQGEQGEEEEESEEEAGRKVRDGEGGISVTLTDPDLLDCPICLEPLIPPVYQCFNGHIACSTCYTKIMEKCPFCSNVVYIRCLAIEKVIESIKISCQNAQYGCKERVSYAQNLKHEETCIHAPFACPLSDCTFLGSLEELPLHFSLGHWGTSPICFYYNCPFSVVLHEREQFLVLQEGKDGFLFLINNRTETIGNAISVTCIGTRSSKEGFFYNLISRGGGSSSLKLESCTEFAKRQAEDSPKEFLLIPNNFNRWNDLLQMEVCIWRMEL
ncbi:hypothetical protein NE237_020435 [Protea cynaroides]|uniref:RING-type E3 ubiquitin transferase n=1 Tax=Protea cynaroides TaxID=273540 RepID=A0A9Q0H785_9MAGN|nr:hypothetical protein NE237_020435 [Protea cynaroides]